MRKLVVGLVALVAVVVGGSWFYIKVIEGDPAPKLTIDSTSQTTAASGAADDGTTDGTWQTSSASVVQYRVKETLFGASTEAVGKTNQIAGSVEINDTTVTTGRFTVDMTSVSSDRTQRDGQFQGRIMNTAQYPTAAFELTSPITLSSVEKDKEVTATAAGKLTLHGVTKTVTFDVTAKRVTGAIKVNGSIPVHFADYKINNPSGGPASVGNDGTLEFTLVLTR